MLVGGLAQARPWIEPDDARMRHSLQWLADQGCLQIPVTTWPVMWADVSAMLRNDSVSPECRRSQAWRYVRFEHDFQTRQGYRLRVHASGASHEPLFRDFSGGPREEAGAGARLEWLADGLAVGLATEYVHDPRDEDSVRRDGSYIAGALGNWILGVGALDRWWGPGWHSSDILSDNARPVPAVWLNRRSARPLDWPIARWLGPWNLTILAGQLESERAVADAKLLGARFNFRPVPSLEVGMSRVAHWGGEDRPETLRSLRKCAIGDSNDPVDGEDGPGACSQLAGFDLRWSLPAEQVTPAVYAQAIGEDEAGMLPSKYMALAGFELATATGAGEQRWFVEYTDNIAGTWPSEQRPNVAFENSGYQTGHRFRGRNLASTFESDARVVSLGHSTFLSDGRELGIILTHAALNRDGTLPTSRREEGGVPVLDPADLQRRNIAFIRYRQPFPWGRVSLAGWFMDREVESRIDETETRTWPRATIMASWEYRLDL